jgi:hypothetical protein
MRLRLVGADAASPCWCGCGFASSVRVRLCLVGATCVLAAVLSSGCLVSALHPVYDNDSIVADEALVGTWESKESQITVGVSKGEWRSYEIAYTDRFATTRFTAHLTAIGGARFLNVRPEDGLERPAFVMATNGPLQIAVTTGQVRVRELDYATVLARHTAGTLKLAAATDLKQNVLITAETPALRAWLAGALKDETIFAEWKTFTRRTK